MADSDDESHNETTDGHTGEDSRVRRRPRLSIRNSDRLSINQIQQLLNNCVIDCLQPMDGLIESAHQLSLIVNPHSFTSLTTRPQNHSQSEHKRKKKRKFHYSCKQLKSDLKRDVSEEVYLIEAIRDVKLNNESKLMFYIKWKGYGEDVNTWQTSDDLFECDSHYQHYYSQQFAEEVIDYDMNDFYTFATCLSEAVGTESDTAVVLKLNNVDIKAFNRTDKQLQQLKQNLRQYRKALKIINEEMKTFEKRRRDHFWPQKILIQYLVREMNIEDNFGGLKAFFEFVEQRKHTVQKLKKWETKINKQLVECGFADDRIWVENHVDLEVPAKISYLHKYQMHTTVVKSCRVKAVSCKCTNNCIGDKPCVCVDNINNDCGFKSSFVMHECNSQCKCSHECPNRRLQKGSIGAHLVLFRTSGKGWGVMTRKRIPRDSYVMQYLGEVIDSSKTKGRDTTYFFNIDAEFCGQTLFIDAEYYANITRFVNHSCEPNLDHHLVAPLDDKQFVPRIGFFANRDIKEYEELTYDYNCQTLSIDQNGFYIKSTNSDDNSSDSGYTSSSFTTTSHECVSQSAANESSIRCLCGAKKCRQLLPF